MNKRNGYIDFVKGLLIFLVLFGHMIQYGSGETYLAEGLYWENWPMKVIYSFHMPLFVAISGFLTYRGFQKATPFAALLKRCKKLLLPIATWVPIVMLLAFLFDGQPFSVKGVIRTFLTDFWFLWSVLFCTAGLAVAESLPRRYRPVFYVAAAILILFSPDVIWSNAHKFMFPFFAAGYYFAKSEKNIQNRRLLKAGIATALWVVLLLFYNKNTYIYTTGISLIGGNTLLPQIGIVVYRYMVGFAGCLAVLFLLSAIWRKAGENVRGGGTVRAILWLGKHSLAMYILSTYLYVYAVPRIIPNAKPSIILNLIGTVLITVMLAGLTMIVNKCKPLSKALIGE